MQQLQRYLLLSKGRKRDPTVRAQHWEQRYGSPRTKTWQGAEVATQKVRAECRSIYDEHDRCESGLSNRWQSWWQNRQDKKTGVSCNHLSAKPPHHHHHRLLPLSATDRGDTGSRVFLWWAADRAAIHPALMGSAFVLVSTSGVYGIFMLWYLHTMGLIYQSFRGTCAFLSARIMVQLLVWYIKTAYMANQSRWRV